MTGRLLVVALAALAAVPAALADGETRVQGYASTYSATVPNVLGVSVNVFGPRNQIRVSNYSGKTVVVRGLQGEPFLRFRGQTVYANLGSPTWYISAREPVPAAALTDAPPRWRKVARSASYTWHDHRVNWIGTEPPPAVRKAPAEAHLIFHWRIPATADGKPFAITGFLGWAPPPKTPGGGTDVALIAGVAAAGVLVLVLVGLGVRRARRRTPGPVS